MEKKAKVIVSDILMDLKNRGGFDGWWSSIDTDIQQEIIDDLEDLVLANLDEKCCDDPKFAGTKQFDICENCGRMKKPSE